MADREPNTEGRKQNAASPLGERNEDAERVKATGRRERESGGPDSPRAEDVGKTFKQPPKR